MVARKTVLKPAPARPALAALLDRAKARGVSEQELAEQRVSFAYGNAPGDANRITKESARTASLRNKLTPS